MLAMAAGRSSGVATTASTRTRGSLSARGSPITSTTTTTTSTISSSSSSGVESVVHDTVTGTSDERALTDNADDNDEEDDASASAPANGGETSDDDAAAAALDSEDENEWEDIEYDEPAFRDLAFPDDDDDAAADISDSEYAPSEANGESDDEDASDLDDEEEEASPAGLFANVLRRFGRHKRRASAVPGDLDDPSTFTDADRVYWTSAEAKAQWAARFNAANTQFVHTYGCRIDSPALPEANAKLRREKKKRSAYTLVLFALCAAYFVQLVVMYAATSTTAAAVSRSSLDAVSSAVASVATAIASIWHQLDAFAPGNQNNRALSESVLSTDSERVVVVTTAVDDVVPTSSTTNQDDSESESESTTDSEAESAAPTAAVERCGKLLTRVVKETERKSAIRDSATRACDAAVALAPLASPTLVEALVLRGDLFSLASDFDAAASDYDRASAVYASLPTLRAALAPELELKTLANRWIQLFVQKRRKELRLELTHAAKRSDSSALQALAATWLSAFKSKQQQQLMDVLAATRMWTYERLVYR